MQRRVSGEQVEQQIHRQLGVEDNAGIQEVFGTQVAAQIHHDQAAAASLGKPAGSLTQNRHRSRSQLVLAAAAKQNPDAAGAQQLHQPAQLPLPENRQGEAAGQHQGINKLASERQVGVALHHPGQGHQQQIAPQQPQGAGLGDPAEHNHAQTEGE